MLIAEELPLALDDATGRPLLSTDQLARSDEPKAVRARAAELTEGDWAAAGVKAAIDEVTTLMIVLMV